MVEMIKDESRVDEVLKALDELSKGYVEVGVLSDNSSEILLIAQVNEYGVDIRVTDKMRGYLNSIGIHLKKDTKFIKIPERSYIRSSFDENKNKLIYKAEDLLVDVVNLKISPTAFFDALGKESVAIIQNYMKDLKRPPNHPVTIAQKGSSNPLIDTGRLIGSIDYKVKFK